MMKPHNFAVLVSFCLCLAGCGTAGDNRDALPSYATPINNGMGWSVKCPLQTVSNPLNRNFDIFVNEDGSPKTYEQFCAESDSARRTTR